MQIFINLTFLLKLCKVIILFFSFFALSAINFMQLDAACYSYLGAKRIYSCFFFFKTNIQYLAQLSHNVIAWRRFDSPNKQTVGLQGWQTVDGAKYRRGQSPNGVLRNPEATEGSEALSDC